LEEKMDQNYQPYNYDPQIPPAGEPYTPPPQRNTSRTVMIVVGVLLLLCCCCVGGALLFYYVLGDIFTDAMGITRLIPAVLAL
jgi:hypothetical protein